MEASALPAPAAVARTRTSIGGPLLRLRSDEQLVALFRAGNDDAFRVIHDRYRQRLFAYTRQMLSHRQDAEDALQDIFVRAYAGLRANHRELALRAWLYRVAHNRCIDELRRPAPPPPEVMELLRSPVHDPIAEADQRESLRRLIADVRRLPDQQRSALLMRELGGMSYADLAAALGVTVPAVKSLLVRARLALAQALEARDTACSDIREELIVAHDRGLRPNAMARRHMRDCPGCRDFRHQLRGVSRRFAAIVPTLGPLGVLANLLGVGAGGAGSGAAGGVLAAGAGSGSALVSVGAVGAGAGHVATLLAAAVVTAGGAVELQQTITPPPARHHHHVRVVKAASAPVHASSQAVAAPSVSPPDSSQAAASTPVSPPPPPRAATPQAPAAQKPAAASPETTQVSSTVTIKRPTKSKPKATGGTPAAGSVGGAAPTGSSTGAGKPSAGTTTVTSTDTAATTGTGSADPTQQPSSATSTTLPGSSPVGSTTSSPPATLGSGGDSTSTGSPANPASTGGSSTPSQ